MKFISERFIVTAGVIGFSLTANPAHASSTNGYGNITNVSSTAEGILLFNVDLGYSEPVTRARKVTSRRDAQPSCAAAQPDRWAIDGSTISGQVAVMTLLWAKERNKQISVNGTGKCVAGSDIEMVAKFDILDGA